MKRILCFVAVLLTAFLLCGCNIKLKIIGIGPNDYFGITHSGKDKQGGCEDLIRFDIANMDTTNIIYTTRHFRFDCEQHRFDIKPDFLPFGLSLIWVRGVDDSNNIGDFRKYNLFYRLGYDSTFTADIQGDTLFVTRPPLPHNYVGLEQYALISWMTPDSGLSKFYEFGHTPEYTVKVPTAILPDVIHLTVTSRKDVAYTGGLRTYFYPSPYEMIVQIRPQVWIGPLRRL